MPISIRRVIGARRVVGVQRREHEVAGERRLDGDLRRLAVADLADHDDVGVGAHHRAQAGGERQARPCC